MVVLFGDLFQKFGYFSGDFKLKKKEKTRKIESWKKEKTQFLKQVFLTHKNNTNLENGFCVYF